MKLELFLFTKAPELTIQLAILNALLLGKLPVQSSHTVGGLSPHTDAVSTHVMYNVNLIFKCAFDLLIHFNYCFHTDSK